MDSQVRFVTIALIIYSVESGVQDDNIKINQIAEVWPGFNYLRDKVRWQTLVNTVI
jgi:hypothetical protein